MLYFDRDLVRVIYSGKCMALVGTGPSCELNLPNWKKLTNECLMKFEKNINSKTINECKSLIEEYKFPEVFTKLESVIGIDELLNYIEEKTNFKLTKEGHTYNILSEWPFVTYLTTNYDDLLYYHLSKKGYGFLVYDNSEENLKLLRHDSEKMIFKIHGDFKNKDDIVLTSEQYKEFRFNEKRAYWRDKILSVINVLDLVIIGYSNSDPDFIDQLERAKKISDPKKPIFMFATGFSRDEIIRYYKEYNIRIIPYNNDKGDHKELTRLLNRYSHFIAKRNSAFVGNPVVDEEITKVASSMYLFTKLRLEEDNIYILKIYAALILQTLYINGRTDYISKVELINKLESTKFFNENIDPESFNSAVDYLYERKYIDTTGNDLKINNVGKLFFESIKEQRKILVDKFRKDCEIFLTNNFTNLSSEQYEKIIDLMRNALIKVFETRGLEIARSNNSDTKIDISDANDILDTVNSYSNLLEKSEEKTAFVDLMIEILLRPEKSVKEYLAALSQGYFSYHALGLNPSCNQSRLDIEREKFWILDSSIILPLLAKDCFNYEYSHELFNKIVSLSLKCITTEKLLIEVIEHALWAIRNFVNKSVPLENLTYAALGMPGYKQNLFVNGYSNWLVDKGNPQMDNYMKECIGTSELSQVYNSIKDLLIKKYKIDIIDFEKEHFFNLDVEIEKIELTNEILSVRKREGTYTNDDQCIAEAEIILYSKYYPSLFISSSSVLNRVKSNETLNTFKPESLYRFLTLFSKKVPKPEILFECMTQDFFFSGFDIINKDTVQKISNPLIRQNRMNFDQEKETYIKSIGEEKYLEYVEEYEKKPDEQKPFFSMQFAYMIARKESEDKKIIQKRFEEVEEQTKLTKKERIDYLRLKSKRDQKKKKHKKTPLPKKKKKGK